MNIHLTWGFYYTLELFYESFYDVMVKMCPTNTTIIDDSTSTTTYALTDSLPKSNTRLYEKNKLFVKTSRQPLLLRRLYKRVYMKKRDTLGPFGWYLVLCVLMLLFVFVFIILSI